MSALIRLTGTVCPLIRAYPSVAVRFEISTVLNNVKYSCDMFCTKCGDWRPTVANELKLEEFRIEGNIRRINCTVCQNFIAVVENNKVINLDEIVDASVDGWKQVETNREHIIYYVLSQIIYPEIDTPKKEELESLYDFADRCDHIFLRWLKGHPVGFYTVKTKGTEIFNIDSRYSMNTVDTAYIRSQHRNQGLGMEILYDAVKRYENQDIGFSKPISHGMLQVIRRFLMKHKDYRLHFWEVENGGIEGSVKLLWFTLRKQIQN